VKINMGIHVLEGIQKDAFRLRIRKKEEKHKII
jgi:hypothetical protein